MSRILNPWSYSYIRKLTDEATLLAQQAGLRPTLASEAAMNWRRSKRFNVPFIGNYVPEGWVRGDEQFFVDTTGRAVPGSQAIPATEFYKKLIENTDPTVGYGVIEMGQTQVTVVLYRKEAHAKTEET